MVPVCNKRTSHGTRQLQGNNTSGSPRCCPVSKDDLAVVAGHLVIISRAVCTDLHHDYLRQGHRRGLGNESADDFVSVGILILSIWYCVTRRQKALGAIAGRLDYLIGVGPSSSCCFAAVVHRRSAVASLSRLKQFDSLRDFFTGPSAALGMNCHSCAFPGRGGHFIGVVAVFPLILLGLYIVIGMLAQPAVNRSVQSGRARTDKQNMLMQTFDGRRNQRPSVAGPSGGNASGALWQAVHFQLPGVCRQCGDEQCLAGADDDVRRSGAGYRCYPVMSGAMSIGA